MAVYFSSFIPYYALLVQPLFDLLKEGVPWNWMDSCERAFTLLKDSLASAPVCGHPIRGSKY